MHQEDLYYVALYLPEEHLDFINRYKLDFAHRFHSKEALKVKPHITIKNPFKFYQNEKDAVIKWFQKLYVNVPSFDISIKNFGAFHNKYSPVIFLDPICPVELYMLQKEVVTNFWSKFPDKIDMEFEKKFKPHVTIAYRDLAPENFEKAWNEYRFREHPISFKVNEFHLLKHDSKRWNIIDTYPLN